MTCKPVEERALHQHIRRRTVRLLDFTDKSAGGSAVTVKLRNRYFLATAAHVIPNGHEIRILVGEGHDENISSFLARHVDENDDVGLLELDESTAGKINRDFTAAEQLLLQLDQSSGWCATLIGYPSQSVVTEQNKVGSILHRTHSFATLTIVTELIPRKEWPRKASFERRPPLSRSDLFVKVDPNTVVYQQDLTDLDPADSPSNVTEVQLAGMSGCGIWLDRVLDDEIWRPEPILAGIDTGALPKQGWARGTQISRWLKLVIKHYKDLKEIGEQLKRNSK